MTPEVLPDIAAESWRPVDTPWAKLYEVSNFGRVRIRQIRQGYRSQFLKPFVEKSGYSRVAFWSNGCPRYYRVHRLVAQAFVGNVHGYVVNHLNGIKSDSRAINLEVVRQRQNMEHASRLDLMGKKLTNADATKIRKLRAEGWSSYSLAKRFGVTKRSIQNIYQRKTFRHVGH